MKKTRFGIQILERFKNLGLEGQSFSRYYGESIYKKNTALKSDKSGDYEFLDCGNLKRLERFGGDNDNIISMIKCIEAYL